jgi:hypothetical protein
MINFAGTSFETETQYKMIRDLLFTGVFDVEFTKINGELRTLSCTLNSEILPKTDQVKEVAEPKTPDFETISVWVPELKSWRSFKTMNVISVKVPENVGN